MTGTGKKSPNGSVEPAPKRDWRAGKSRHGSDSGATQGLAQKIDKMRRSRHVETARTQRSSKNATDMSRGLRLATEFAVAILVGAGMGYVFDGWFDTRPWIMITMLALGFAAGIKNVLMTVQEMNAETAVTEEMNLRPDESQDSMWDDLDD